MLRPTSLARLRLARRAQPLAGDAPRRPSPPRASRTGATSGCRSRPSSSTETARALRAAGFRGANVTIPHKEVALAIADDATDSARAIGAANTLTYGEDGAIHADNTDAPGLIDAIEGRPPRDGGGARRGRERARRGVGAAHIRHARAGLEPHGGRAPGSASRSCPSWTPPVRPICSSTRARSLAIRPGPSSNFRSLPMRSARYPCLVDLVYRSGPTALDASLRVRRGVTVVGGLEILVRQGARSFERWTGHAAPLDVLRTAARGEPAPRDAAAGEPAA